MSRKGILKEKSFLLAVRVVRLFRYLTETKREFVIAKQVLRSGTSIGANVREAQNAESSADFIHKLSIAQKEADETLYWLELHQATEYLSEPEFASIQSEVNEILKMLKSAILTKKQNTHSS